MFDLQKPSAAEVQEIKKERDEYYKGLQEIQKLRNSYFNLLSSEEPEAGSCYAIYQLPGKLISIIYICNAYLAMNYS